MIRIYLLQGKISGKYTTDLIQEKVMPGFGMDAAFGEDQHCIPDVRYPSEQFHRNHLSASPNHTVETARKHRFVLDILTAAYVYEERDDDTTSAPLGDLSTGILLYLEKCTRPTPEFDKITIHNGQDEIYRPGKIRWNPIEFTFYEKASGEPDDLTDQTTELIYKWWAKSTAVISESRHVSPSDYYKNAELSMLDGEGRSIWTYFLYDCWIQKVTPSDLSYQDTDIATTSVTMNFNKAREAKQKRAVAVPSPQGGGDGGDPF